MSLPTYQAATRKPQRKDALELVMKYIHDSRDLTHCCRVNKEWHEVFMDALWENPLSKVRGYANVINFFASISSCSAAGRIRIVDGRQCFRGCDGLCHCNSSDMAISIPAINGSSMPVASKTIEAAIRRLAVSKHLTNADYLILDTRGVQNVAKAFNLMELWDRRPLLLSLDRVHLPLDGLASLDQNALPFFQRVRYLNLSNSIWCTTIIKPPLSMFGAFPNVTVLKLRGCGLTDQDVSILRRNQLRLGQLTCLDLRDNFLTDRCEADLIYFVDDIKPTRRFALYPYKILTHIEATPEYEVDHSAPPDPEHPSGGRIDPSAGTIPDDLDAFIAWAKYHGNLDTVPNTGLRQLYLSGNNMSLKLVISMLLARSFLETFHCDASGNEGQEWWMQFVPPRYVSEEKLDESPIQLIVALCSYQHAPKLERLTIHHSFVTDSASTQERNGRRKAPGEQHDVVETPNEMSRFLPGVNNNLQYLELVGVPALGSPKLLSDLKHFLMRAAMIENDLRLYRSTHPTSRHSPRVLPGLKKLVIRLTNKLEEDLASVTEDQDAERFMRESENDFSFFEDERGRGRRSAYDEELEKRRIQRVDIRAGLADYRRQTREHHAKIEKEHGTESARTWADRHSPHWGGDLVVVRPSD